MLYTKYFKIIHEKYKKRQKITQITYKKNKGARIQTDVRFWLFYLQCYSSSQSPLQYPNIPPITHLNTHYKPTHSPKKDYVNYNLNLNSNIPKNITHPLHYKFTYILIYPTELILRGLSSSSGRNIK